MSFEGEKTIKTTIRVHCLLKNLKDKLGESMYKINERALEREYQVQGLEIPENLKVKEKE